MASLQKRGKKGMWYVNWRENGIPQKKPISTDKQAANEYKINLELRLYRKRAGLIIKKYPFADFCKEYIDIYSTANKRPASIDRDRRTIKIFKDKFPHIKSVDSFDADTLEQYKASRLQDNVKESSINRELNTLTNMIKYAEQKRYIEKSGNRVKRFSVSGAARERVLTDDEFKRLYNETYEPYRTAFLLGICGLRSGEACHLEWTDIDFDKRIMRIREKADWKPKNQSSVRDVPLHPYVMRKLLKRAQACKSTYVLSFEDGRRLDERVLCGMITKFRKKLNIPGLCFHVLRHTFVSRMAGAGADIYAISKMVGHSNTKITENVYTHLKDTYYQANIEKMKIPL